MASFVEAGACSVVFSLPHLRDAIFAFHKALTAKRRQEVLGAVERPVNGSIWGPVPDANYWKSHKVQQQYEGDLKRLQALTNIFAIMEKLGLKEAAYIDFCLSRPLEIRAWLCVYNQLRGTKEVEKFEAHPRSRLRSGARHEEPTANPMEMFLYGVREDHYSRNGRTPELATHSQQFLLRDDEGEVVMLRTFDTAVQPFLAEASQRCPELLFAPTSPFLPILDVMTYSAEEDLALVLTYTPPWTFSKGLAPCLFETGDELRRVLERGRDLYSHLVELKKHGISIDGDRPGTIWPVSLTHSMFGPFLVPSYVRAIVSKDKATRFTRMGVLEEQLPTAPPTAWPLPCREALPTARIPWCYLAAYHDPRVQGPTNYIHGLDDASWSNDGAEERREKILRPQKEDGDGDIWFDVEPASRYHADLIMMTEIIVRNMLRFTAPTHEDIAEFLRASVASDAYEATLATPARNLPGATQHHLSALFTWCLIVRDTAFEMHDRPAFPSPKKKAPAFDGHCARCNSILMVSALPEDIRLLLLRIVEPPTGEDGEPVIVTAEEALEVFDKVLATEGPKMQKKYEEWADLQGTVVRPERPDEVTLDEILKSKSYHRLLLFENLRGNHLGSHPYLSETDLFRTRYYVTNELTRSQKKKAEELRALCGTPAPTKEEDASKSSSGGKRGAENQEKKNGKAAKKVKM